MRMMKRESSPAGGARVGVRGLSVLQAYVPSLQTLQTRPAYAEWEHAIYKPAYCALFLHQIHRMKEGKGGLAI